MKKAIPAILVFVLLLGACGGSTAPAAPAPVTTAAPTPAPAPAWTLVESGAEVIHSGSSDYLRAWYVIENTGESPLDLDMLHLDVETSDGKLVQTIKYVQARPGTIMPGERAAWEGKTSLEAEAPDEGLQIHALPEVTRTQPARRLPVEEFELFADKYGMIKARGRVVNDTDGTLENVWVSVLCYGADGGFLGALWCEAAKELPAGEKQGFETTIPDGKFLPEDVADYTIIAYPYFG